MTKVFSIRKLAVALVAPLIAVGLASCGGSDDGFQQQLLQYVGKDRPAASAQAACSAYFDLSDGMVLAYGNNKDAATFLNATVQRLTSGDSCSVYALADDKISRLNLRQTQLYNKIVDAGSYTQQMAPIEKTLGKIVSEGKSSLLVTDFEEFTPDRKVQHQSFATRYFVEWLKRGGDITFFVYNFKGMHGMAYHLYFIVFDDNSHRLMNAIREAASVAGGYREFRLACNVCTVTTGYPSASKGGNYHDAESGEDIVTGVLEDGSKAAYKNFGTDVRAEYYPLGVSWADALKNSQEATQEGFSPKFKYLFSNLFLDFSNRDSYIVRRVAVRVTDVESDFELYTDYRRALADKDKSGEFYGEDGKLLPALDYKKNRREPAEIKDMLVIDDKLFAETLAKSASRKAEVGIRFAPAFNGNIIGGEPGDLYRIDIVIADCQPNIGSQLDELFAWGANNNLRDAVRNTLQMLSPNGTVVYTYFAKSV